MIGCLVTSSQNSSLLPKIGTAEEMSELFHLPLSVEAYDQFQQLISLLDDTHLLQGKDKWSYIWGSNEFASNKAYLRLMGTRQISPAYTWLWNSYCQPKQKVFFWLVLKDRLSTRGTSEKGKKYGVGKLQLCALSFGH